MMLPWLCLAVCTGVLTDDEKTWGTKLQPDRMITKPGSALAGARFPCAIRNPCRIGPR